MARVPSAGGWVLTGGKWKRSGFADVSPGVPSSGGAGLLVGAVEPVSVVANYADWTARNTAIGSMGIRRSYDPTTQNKWLTGNINNCAVAFTLGKGIVNYFSFTPPDLSAVAAGNLDSTLTSLAVSIPSTDYLLISVKHEPEDADPATWRACHQRAYSVIKANVASPSKVLVGPCFQGYTFNPASGRKWQTDWMVAKGFADFVGVDYYNPYHYPSGGNSPNWTTPFPSWFFNHQSMCDSLGVPGTFGEFGTAEDNSLLYKGVQASAGSPNPQHKIDWLGACIANAETNGWLAACYFDSYKPGDTDPTMPLDSTTATTNYWKSVCAAHTARSF